VTIALNAAFHSDHNAVVPGPWKSIWRMTRLKFFAFAFGAMFIYFWIPNFLFEGLSIFSWMTWIAPNNAKLAVIAGCASGLGLNPFPTFDWNIVTFMWDPLMLPSFSIINNFMGMFLTMPIIAAMYYSNVWGGAYFASQFESAV
jgi:hypothetical protein